jgi:hypothetical protein
VDYKALRLSSEFFNDFGSPGADCLLMKKFETAYHSNESVTF